MVTKIWAYGKSRPCSIITEKDGFCRVLIEADDWTLVKTVSKSNIIEENDDQDRQSQSRLEQNAKGTDLDADRGPRRRGF